MLLATSALLFTLSGGTHAAEPTPRPSEAARSADAARGETLYAANCTACHGAQADGRGPAAVALTPRPTDFTRAASWKGRSDADMVARVRAGRPGTSMTAFPHLSEAEAADIVAWLRTRVTTPPVAP
jgi:mono/diheme cytochrome c family protein